MRALNLVFVILLLILALPTLSCFGPSKETIAVDVAKEWTEDNTAALSEAVTELITSSFTGLSFFSSQIEDQIAELVIWSYPHTELVNGNTYKVTARCTSVIDILAVGRYEVSVDFNLTIDTGTKVVTSWPIDYDSFSLISSGDSMVLVSFDGWYVGGTNVQTASKSDSVTAKITLAGGTSGEYTLRVRRDISWASDENVTVQSFSYDGIADSVQVIFTPPYATDESSTNGYHLDLQKGGSTEWTMEDSYPPRLTVT